MPDYRLMYDSDYLFAFHLQGRECTVEIESVKGGELTGEGGRKAKKPVLRFKGKDKPFAVNKTNGKIIATLYGADASAWVGKRITIYPTMTEMNGDQIECIRVR